MASPSEVSWMSHSIAKLPAIAAFAAPGMFSTIPREISCRPRCATGRAVSQSGAFKLRHLEQAFDLDRGIRRQGSDADGGGGVPPLVAEHLHHQIGGAVHHFRPVDEIRRRIDEAAEPYHAHHLVEIAEGGLDLRQKIDGAAARGGSTLLDRDTGPELALGDQLARRVEANLAGYEQQISAADEADIIRDGSRGLVQGDAKGSQFLFDRARHVSSPILL